jgi:PAS domain S-box-containing protein
MDRAISSTSEGVTLSEVSMENEPLVYVNGGFERITGYNRQDIIGENCRFLQGTETDKNEVAKIRNAINNRQSCTVEMINYKKGGEKFWNRLTVSPVSLPDDKVQYYVGVQCDITHIKEAEHKLQKYAEELEEKNLGMKGVLEEFDKTLGRKMYKANNSAQKLSENSISDNEDLAKALEQLKEATESANDLILNMRSALVHLGGTKHLHNIDLVNFKAIRKYPDSNQ